MKRMYFLAVCLIPLGAWAADTPVDSTITLKPAQIKSADEVKKSTDAKKSDDVNKPAQAKKKTDDSKKSDQAKNKPDSTKNPSEAKKNPVPDAKDNMTAAQLVEKNVNARGGLKGWQSAITLTFAGKMDAGGKENVQLPFVMKMKRSHKSRMEITFQDQTAVQVYDGASGWKFRPFLGRNEVEPYSPLERKLAAAWDDLDGPLVDYAKKGTKVSLDGKEKVEGQDAYRLKLKLKDGSERRIRVDAKSFLEVKTDGQPRMLDGKPHKVAIFYRDYKPENGLMVPRVLETVVEGVKERYKMNIESVVVNQPMDDALFAKPQVTAQVSAPGK